MATINEILCKEFNKKKDHIDNIVTLIDDGNTIPFIARYRKEMHGTTDDQTLRAIADRLTYLRNLETRRSEVKKSIEEQGKLTEELSAAIDAAATLAEVEDLYRPYKPKRRTRASVAREKGLEPLAAFILAQEKGADVTAEAEKYIDEEKGVATAEDALAGAKDIIAEDISDDADLRKALKTLWRKTGMLRSEGTTEEDTVYSNYYDHEEPFLKVQGHRVLAMNRGEREGILKVSLAAPREEAVKLISDSVITGSGETATLVQEALEDSYDRLIAPSVERELRNELTETADEGAIKAFALNLRPLLMQPPIKGRVVLGFDPAYRTGCKIAVVDPTGKVLATSVVYPTPPHNKTEEAKKILTGLIRKYGVTVIAIGNGTASRESEKFVADLIKGTDVAYVIVSEAGASVYSASKLGAEEFPEFDVSLRSAVSIARRLQDPLAELVKIDPKSIGVGQYQHDMPQQRLGETLDGVVEDCVNAVGVDLNTASPSLLTRVSGLSSGVAKNVVAYREQNGEFVSRRELLKVSKLGPKAFEQCAGFLRIPGGKEMLDNTGVHPESYDAARKLLDICGIDPKTASAEELSGLDGMVKLFGAEKVAEKCGVGLPTLNDIIRELMKPGRDPRDDMPQPILRSDVTEMKDLVP